MSRRHEEFEMFTALAAVNQLSDHESEALNEHLQSCASCRSQLMQMKAASYSCFVHHCAHSGNSDLPDEVSERFSRRLASLGIAPSSLSIANPVRSLRLAIAILAFAILAPTVAGVLTMRHRQSSSEQTEIATGQSVSEPHAALSGAFNMSRPLGTYARPRRSRHSGTMKKIPSHAQDLYSTEEHLPHFRLGYPEVLRTMYPEPSAIASVPPFPLIELGKTSDGAKTFELASLPPLGQSDVPNVPRFIPPGDLAHPGSISVRPQFNLPPLTDGSLFSTHLRH